MCMPVREPHEVLEVNVTNKPGNDRKVFFMNKRFHSKNSSVAKLVLTSLLFSLIGLTACQQEGGPPPAPPPPEVKVMTIVAKTIPDEVEFIGQTASFRPVEIRSQVTGIIKKVLFTEGRDVRKGEKLYLIDPVPFRASFASAKGRVGQALARLAQARAELARVRPLTWLAPPPSRIRTSGNP